MLIPKIGTLERIFLDGAIAADQQGRGVTYLDFVGTGITEENIDQIVQNLRTNMFESEQDEFMEKDS